MADSTGMHSHKTRLFVAPWGTASPAGVEIAAGGAGAFDEVEEVISLNGIPMNPSVTRLTHLTSDDKAHEKIPGILDGGQANFQLNFTQAAFVLLESNAPDGNETTPDWDRKVWVVQFPTGDQLFFKGFIQGYPVEVPEDDRITIQVTIEISGRPFYIIGA